MATPAVRCGVDRERMMATKGFAVSHARDARFERGLRSFFEYRDLGIEAATGMPAGFATEEVAAVDEHGAARRE